MASFAVLQRRSVLVFNQNLMVPESRHVAVMLVSHRSAQTPRVAFPARQERSGGGNASRYTHGIPSANLRRQLHQASNASFEVSPYELGETRDNLFFRCLKATRLAKYVCTAFGVIVLGFQADRWI